MTDIPVCPECAAGDSYLDGNFYVCPYCAHEWSVDELQDESPEAPGSDEPAVLDSNGNRLESGDSVILVKDLRLKGSSTVIKKGTRIKGIRLVDGDHEVDCKVDGMAVMLKAEFLKKA